MINWEAIGAVGEIVGALAVVVTLGYLGVQTRLVHRAARSDASQRILDEWSDALEIFIGTEGNRSTLAGGLADHSTLDPANRLLFNHWLGVFASNLFNAVRLHDDGILDDEAFQWISDSFVATCRTAGGAAWWREQEAHFAPRLVRHVREELATRREDFPDVGDLYHLSHLTSPRAD